MRDPKSQSLRSHRLSRGAVAIVALAALVSAVLAPHSAAAQGNDTLITVDGVAGAELGATIEEIEDALSDYVVSDDTRLTVDLRGHTVSQDGRIAFRAAQVIPDSPQIELFIISNDIYRTADGIGPGTSIDDAVSAYGKATFILDRNNSGREFVMFADQPKGQIAFRTFGVAGAYIGNYAEGESMTSEYQDDAAIASVWVGCTTVKACIRSGGADISGDTAQADADARAAAEAAAEQAAAEAAAAAQAAAEEAAAAESAEQAEAATSTGSSASQTDVLAKTGLAQTRTIAVVAGLILFGFFFVVFERRRGLGPEWLR